MQQKPPARVRTYHPAPSIRHACLHAVTMPVVVLSADPMQICGCALRTRTVSATSAPTTRAASTFALLTSSSSTRPTPLTRCASSSLWPISQLKHLSLPGRCTLLTMQNPTSALWAACMAPTEGQKLSVTAQTLVPVPDLVVSLHEGHAIRVITTEHFSRTW